MTSRIELPAGYRQVEYIQSNGTQYVDSGVIPTTNTKVEAEIDFLSGNTTYNCIFGVGQTNSNQFVVYRLNASAMVGQVYSTKTYNSSGVTITGRHKVTLSNSEFVYGTYSTTVTAESFTYTYPIFLFALNSVGSATLHAHQKLYSCKIYNGNSLIRNFIPCINPSGTVGLYDTVNAKFYGNSGTGVFTAGRKVYKESEVTKLEYIESDGSQYIDSDYIPNSNTRVVMDAEATNTTNGVFFGGRSSNTSNSFTLFSLNGVYRTDYGAVGQVTTISLASNVRRTIDKNKNVTTIDGTAYTITAATFTAPVSMAILAVNSAGTISYKISAKLYSCQIYDNALLIRDYYPAEIDGAIGLWDAVSGVLYTDAAGGTFIAGPYLAVDTPENFEQILAVYLRWGAVDCEAYKIYRNGSLIGTTTDTFYVDITAEQNTEYTYTLVAYRGATESEPTELTVYTRSGYFVIKPLIESAFFQ